MMNILIYAAPDNHQAGRQLEAIRNLVPYAAEVVDSHTAFEKKYARCLSSAAIVVFFVSNSADLSFLEQMQNDFMDTKLLLSITAENEQLEERAFKLSPRLVNRVNDRPMLLPMMVRGIASRMSGRNPS